VKITTITFHGRINTLTTKNSLFRNWIAGTLEQDGSNLDAIIAGWETNLEPNTVRSLIYLAKECVLYSSGILLDVRDHVRRVERSKQQHPVQALSQTEIIALTRSCPPSEPLHLPLQLALNTGMRRGEVFGLTWEDIDILNNKITVSKSYKGPTKSGKSRILPISYALEKVLLAHIPIKSYNLVRSETVVKKSFDPNPHLKRACNIAGIREITFHALRHTFATLALEAGRSPRLVSNMLGHSKVSTTLDLYWNVTGENLDLEFLPK